MPFFSHISLSEFVLQFEVMSMLDSSARETENILAMPSEVGELDTHRTHRFHRLNGSTVKLKLFYFFVLNFVRQKKTIRFIVYFL